MDNHKVTVCSKKISLDGQILQNVDCGFGYTIVWQKQPINIDNERYGVSPQQILSVLMQQFDFLNKTKYANEKYQQASKKLEQVLNILNK